MRHRQNIFAIGIKLITIKSGIGVFTMLKQDLNRPDFNPPDCPLWAKEALPDFIRQFRGRNGLPPPYCEKSQAIALTVKGIDRYHANQFIAYRKETAEYLYSKYTSPHINYRKGTFPAIEKLAGSVVQGCGSDIEKAVAILMKGVKSSIKRPMYPSCGKDVRRDRNLDDEALFASGAGWCNEQSRIFVRMCQINGIPARLVQLFYSDTLTGHCVAEFYADGRWSMADATWFCVIPGPHGELLSAAQCHDRAEGQKYCGRAYHECFQEINKWADKVNLEAANRSADWNLSSEELAEKMNCFGIINYPLPL